MNFYGSVPVKEGASLRAGTRNDLLDTFRHIDVDNSGDLSKDEVMLMAERLGFKITSDELDNAWKDMDTNKDGKVDFNEFYNWYVSYVE